MQFVILLVGVLVFVFLSVPASARCFSMQQSCIVPSSPSIPAELRTVEDSYSPVFAQTEPMNDLLLARRSGNVEAMQSAKKSLQARIRCEKNAKQPKGIVRKANRA